MKQRLISIFATLTLLLTLLPVQAFAEEAPAESAYAAEETVIEQTSAEEGTPVEEEVPVVEEVPVAESPTGEGTPAEEFSAEVESVTGETQAEEGQPSDEAMPADENPVEEEPVAEENQVAPLVLTCTSSVALPDNDTLLMEYFYQENGGSYSETVPYNTAQQDAYYAAVLPDGCQEFYNQLVTGVEAIARRSGGNDTATVTINWSGIDQGAVSANFNAIYSALLLNVPQYLYWHDKTLGAGFYGNTVYFQAAKDYRVEKTTTIGDSSVYITLDGERMTRVNTALANANNVLTSHAAEIDFAKLTSYKDEICALTNYNYGAASGSGMQDLGSDPWQMIYVFDGDPNTTVVCEGYSKAFKYLCDLSSWNNPVECILVTGVTTGRHMWNVVKIESRNYLADITNCDSGWNLFLCGVSSSTSPYSAAGWTYTLDKEMYTLYSAADLVMSTEAYTPTTTPEPVKNGLIEEGGTWYYYVDGRVATEYTGLVEHGGAFFYVNGGVLDWSYSGLVQHGGYWYYVSCGVLDWSYTGLVEYGGTYFYVNCGMLDWSYAGLVEHGGAFFYVNGGVLDWSYSGLVQHGGYWYYVSCGVLDWSYTGLVEHGGAYFYVNCGMLDWSYTGLVEHGGAYFYVNCGVLDWTFTGLSYYNGAYYRVTCGILDWNYIGLVEHGGMYFYIYCGMLDWNFTGLAYDGGYWYYVEKGVRDLSYNGQVDYAGGYYYDDDGTLQVGTPGTYTVINGVAQI